MNAQSALLLAALLAVAFAFFWPRVGFLARWRRARQLAERSLVEDALKHIHARERRGTLATPESLAGQLNRSVKGALELIEKMEEGELVQSTGAGLVLTHAGRELALRVIRAHRLLERYLVDELRMPLEEIHAAADRREHRVTPEEIDELEARLGYPQTDPHGDPIPTSGGALKELQGTALSDWEVGTPAKIVHLEDEPAELMAQMVAAGLVPGMHIEVRRVSRDQLILWDGEHERVLAPVAASAVQVAALPHPVRPPPKLSSLQPGEFGRVIALRTEGLERRRLLDLGLTPGTVVKCAYPGPLGEPMAYIVRGATIALRREQGEQIEIEPLSAAEIESSST
jgi:DtxR family Mn-dependent transcriptional regulator